MKRAALAILRVLLIAALALAAVALAAVELRLRLADVSFRELLCTFCSPAALAALLALGVALAAPVRALWALRRGDLGALRSLAVLGAVAAALSAGATSWRAHRGYEALRARMPSPPWYVFLNLPDEAALVLVVAAGATLAVALWGSAAVGWARRRGAGPATVVTAIAGAIAALLAAEGLARTAASALALHEGCYGGGPATMEMRQSWLVEVNAPLAPLRLAVLAAAVLGSALILVFARREPARLPSPRAALVPAGVFALGLAATAASWGMGHDVRHPPPLFAGAPLAAQQEGQLPAVASCPAERELVDAPEARLLADGTWLVDGVRGGDAAAAVKILGDKRGLWRQIQPNKPFPGVAYVAAGADVPVADLAPLVTGARAAGYPHLHGLRRLPARHWPTRTLGDLAYSTRLCAATIPADLPAHGTWAEALR